VRSKVEHPFQVMKVKFGFVKVRYRGLKKKAHHSTCMPGNIGLSHHPPRQFLLFGNPPRILKPSRSHSPENAATHVRQVRNTAGLHIGYGSGI
jgi:hypothetical protein